MQSYESERLYLKKIQLNDIDDSFMEWFADEDLMRYYTNSQRKITKEDIINSIEEGEKNKNCFTYGIFYKETNDCIGTIKLGPINWVHGISDLVVLLGNRQYHGKGLAVEAIKLGNELAFQEYDIRKLFGGMYESNVASIKAYTRADWVIEGRLKGHYLNDGQVEDRILVGCFNPKYFK
ncbi:MAG: GNAT family N-acetyltransferase [Sphingobacteriales bacterium]|nr:GNAT family N-acetyltransferase [Sphingobacteriales bacterium]